MTKKELEEIRDKLAEKYIMETSPSISTLEQGFYSGFDACTEILLPKLEHAEKMKESHWQGLTNCLSNNGVLEKNVLELLEEKATLKQIIKDYEEALESWLNYEQETMDIHGPYDESSSIPKFINKAREVLKKHRGNE